MLVAGSRIPSVNRGRRAAPRRCTPSACRSDASTRVIDEDSVRSALKLREAEISTATSSIRITWMVPVWRCLPLARLLQTDSSGSTTTAARNPVD